MPGALIANEHYSTGKRPKVHKLEIECMKAFSCCDASVAFLASHDEDWARLIKLVGPCRHDAKAAREPYQALVRAIAYQQLTDRAGDAIIGRLKGLFEGRDFPTPEDLIAAEFDPLRACGFSASKIAAIKAIAQGTLDGLIPTRDIAATGRRSADRAHDRHQVMGPLRAPDLSMFSCAKLRFESKDRSLAMRPRR